MQGPGPLESVLTDTPVHLGGVSMRRPALSSPWSTPTNHQPIFDYTASHLLVPTFHFVTSKAAAEAQLASCSPNPLIWFNSFRDKRKWRSALEPPHLLQNLVLHHAVYILTSILGKQCRQVGPRWVQSTASLGSWQGSWVCMWCVCVCV